MASTARRPGVRRIAAAGRTSGPERDAGRKPVPARKAGQTERAPVELRRSLLESALRLFEERGYHATAVDDIVRKAGVTKGALYHHFPGKEELLQELQLEYIEDRVRSARAVLEAHRSPRDRLRHLVSQALVCIDQYRSHVAVFAQERRFLGEERFSLVKRKRDELESIYVSVIRQGIEEGVFGRAIQPRIAAFGILGMLTGAYSWYRSDGPLSATKVGEQLCRLMLEGLRGNARRR